MKVSIKKACLFCFVLFLMLSFSLHTSASAAEQKQYVYDNAHLLTKDETKKLEELAGSWGQSAIPILSFLPQTERAVRTSSSTPVIFMTVILAEVRRY